MMELDFQRVRASVQELALVPVMVRVRELVLVRATARDLELARV
jgi:hypothetical protein